MGGLGAYKGVSVLLDGLALLQKTDPGSLRLEIVGQGRELTELERRAARLGLDQAASFHGFLPDRELADLKTCCHGFAAMPGDEPFGLVFAEAAGAGLVLIGPDHGGPLEILDSGRVGLLANPFDSASIADAFRRFRSLAAEERESLRRMAFTAARERFDLENLGPRLSGRIAALLTGG
jgi:glycosyltransferase involved in cell wall biosynthesis